MDSLHQKKYQTTADQLSVVDKQVVVQMKRDRFSESLEGYKVERVQLSESISELTKGLSNNTIQYKDRGAGKSSLQPHHLLVEF